MVRPHDGEGGVVGVADAADVGVLQHAPLGVQRVDPQHRRHLLVQQDAHPHPLLLTNGQWRYAFKYNLSENNFKVLLLKILRNTLQYEQSFFPKNILAFILFLKKLFLCFLNKKELSTYSIVIQINNDFSFISS